MTKFKLATALSAALLTTGCAIDPATLEGMRAYSAGAQQRSADAQRCYNCVTTEEWDRYRRNNPTSTSARGIK